MGGVDKGLIQWQERPLISYAIDALSTLTDQILINANRNQQAYQRFGYPVIADQGGYFDATHSADSDNGEPHYHGPLAGILTAMKRAKTPYLLTVPCDTPLIQGEHLWRMWQTVTDSQADCCVANDGQRLQPVFLLLDCRLSDSLEAYLTAGERKIDRWLQQHHLVEADYSDVPELFQNINTPEQLSALEKPQ